MDVGSTRTKLALVTGDDLTRLGSFDTGDAGARGWEARFDAALAGAGILASISGVAMSSPRRDLPDRLRTRLAAPGGRPVPVAVVGPGAGGLLLDYQPEALGPDRIANAVGAVARWGAPVIVADVGTALTCDLVAAGPRFAGGAIAPGPEAAYQGLIDRVPPLARPGGLRRHGDVPVLPTSTADAVRSGVLRSAGALVDSLARSYRRRVGHCPVVVTGGLGSVAARYGDTVTAVDPDLTLRGIHLACTPPARRRPDGAVAVGVTAVPGPA
ncbi:MAG TPA: type III pantothenate kinase [Acidimicrobiales bacterium]|nr:type III pantothenate kinase [Acidimicrobiales bacterium]